MKVLSSRLLPPPPVDKPRSGVHLSDILKYILIRKDAARFGKKAKAGDRLRWESGFAWERVFSKAVALPQGYGKLSTQTSITKDKIVGTPDFFDEDNRIVVETKWTMMSSAHAIASPHLWHYRVQLMGYCWMLDTDRGDLIVFHTMGNYQRKDDNGLPDPEPWQHALQFNMDELQRNWKMLLVNRDAMLKEKRAK